MIGGWTAVVCLAAGCGGHLPLRPAARCVQPGLSRGVARGQLQVHVYSTRLVDPLP